MFTALDCSSYHCFPMKPEAWPQRFLHSSHPSVSPHDSIRRLEISMLQHRHFPKCPVFTVCGTKEAPGRLPGSLGNKPPPQILCRWHWPRQHAASVPPGAVTPAQGNPDLKASGKGGVQKPSSPAAECVFPSMSSAFCEALPVHRGMPEREWYAPNDKHLGNSSKTKG